MDTKKQAGFAQIIIILLVLALIGGAYYFGTLKTKPNLSFVIPTASPINSLQPTLNPSANWKTYNLNLFSIKLPVEFKQSSTANPVQFLNYMPDQTSGRSYNPVQDKGKLKVEIYTQDSDSLESFIVQQKNNSNEISGPDPKYHTEDLTLDEQPAKLIITSSGSSIAVKHPTQNKVFNIVFGLDFGNYADLSSQILSTFHFLK